MTNGYHGPFTAGHRTTSGLRRRMGPIGKAGQSSHGGYGAVSGDEGGMGRRHEDGGKWRVQVRIREGRQKIDHGCRRRERLVVQFLDIDPVEGHDVGAEPRDKQPESKQDCMGVPPKPPQTQHILLNQRLDRHWQGGPTTLVLQRRDKVPLRRSFSQRGRQRRTRGGDPSVHRHHAPLRPFEYPPQPRHQQLVRGLVRQPSVLVVFRPASVG